MVLSERAAMAEAAVGVVIVHDRHVLPFADC